MNNIVHIVEFEANLLNCSDMSGRRDAVRILSKRVGPELAQYIALDYDLWVSFYFVDLPA